MLPQNVLSESISGIDFEASWRGPVTVRVLASHIIDREVDSFGVTIDYDGVTGDGLGVSKWRGLASVTYEGESFSTTLSGRYVKGGVLKAEWGPRDIDHNEVSDRAYVDLSATYDLSFGGTQLSCLEWCRICSIAIRPCPWSRAATRSPASAPTPTFSILSADSSAWACG